MIGAAQLARLRDGCLFINTARAVAGRRGGAARRAAHRPLHRRARRCSTRSRCRPDSPFRSRAERGAVAARRRPQRADSHKRQGATTVDEIRRFLAGEHLRHRVTPAMLATMA